MDVLGLKQKDADRDAGWLIEANGLIVRTDYAWQTRRFCGVVVITSA